MSDVTCKIKNRTNEDMAERREYGIPWRKGHISGRTFFTTGLEVNTEIGDFCNFVRSPEWYQKEMFVKYIVNGTDSNYIEFLQDYFYRKYKGYIIPYIELPLNDPKRFELYNQTALDGGHPEYMIDKDGNPLKMLNKNSKADDGKPKYIEDQQEQLAKSEEEPKSSGAVDVLDKDGEVIAENVGSIGEAKETTASDDSKPSSEVESQEQVGVEAPKADEIQNEQEQNMAQNAVVFDPAKLGSKSSNRSDNPERKDDYAEHNKQHLAQYPELELFANICGDDKVVKYDNFHGLVLATIYHKGVPEAADMPSRWVIDPGKIRPGFSVLTENPDFLESGYRNPLNTVGIGFDEIYLKTWLFGYPSELDMVDAYNKSTVNSLFFRYVSHNAFENNEIALAAANLYYLTERFCQLNLNIRFKVVTKRSVDDFDLQITENVGLGFFAKDNEAFKGLTITIKNLSGLVYATVKGKHAKEFADLVNSLGMLVYVEPEAAKTTKESKVNKTKEAKPEKDQKTREAKPEKKEGKAKKNKTVELPNGR